jgi:hypothetical protein
MKQFVVWTLPFVFSGAVLLSTNAKPANESERPVDSALATALKAKSIAVPDWEGTEYKKTVAIYNELVAELEERGKSYTAGTETEAGLFDVMDRVLRAALVASRGVNRARLRVDLLTTLGKQGSEVRKTMEKRAQNKKIPAAQAKADLHRVNAFCLVVELEKQRAQKDVIPGQPDQRGPSAIGGGSFRTGRQENGQPPNPGR